MKYLLILVLLAKLSVASATDMIDFKNLQLPSSPNYYLMCPDNYCAAGAQAKSPAFNMPIERLIAVWQDLMKREPRIQLTAQDEQAYHYQYVQRSFLFRFPDYIDIQFIALSNDKSTLAIYSRSKYGYYDFKVNQKRVERWVSDLIKRLY